jgi:hypothetical protein
VQEDVGVNDVILHKKFFSSRFSKNLCHF